MNKILTVILPVHTFDEEVKELLPIALKSVDKDIQVFLVTNEETANKIKTSIELTKDVKVLTNAATTFPVVLKSSALTSVAVTTPVVVMAPPVIVPEAVTALILNKETVGPGKSV